MEQYQVTLLKSTKSKTCIQRDLRTRNSAFLMRKKVKALCLLIAVEVAFKVKNRQFGLAFAHE